MSTAKKQTILLVDDEEGILRALKRVLGGIGVDILTAMNGQEALDLLVGHKVALIMSDQRMPGLTGVEFLTKSKDIAPDATRILLTGYADIDATIGAINDGSVTYYFNKPWDDEVLISRIQESLKMQAVKAENKSLQKLTRQQNEKLKKLNSSLEQRVEQQTAEIREKHRELAKSFMETIKAFSNMIELRFQDVRNHSQRVGALVKKILSKLELNHTEYQDIVVAAFLHDIGKISIPDSVMEKKTDHYSQADWDLIKKHPVLGQTCVYHISGFEEVGHLIRHHHECFDGSGYPDSLVETQIPLGARIIRIADAFDHQAFANGHPNNEALNEASAYLVRKSGTEFDPALVRKFIECDAGREFLFKESSETRYLRPIQLKEGMIVATDVFTQNGMFLVPKGARLSEGMIGRIVKIDRVDPVSDGIQVFKMIETDKEEANYVPT
ncbi:MAG: hypothetical protein DRP47_01195 [Candidatus Zixiibacteriota bacterium]|nr:MAG: hypothetical protein DRP47_01195 [candidate division Zixibacteria bacterium]